MPISLKAPSNSLADSGSLNATRPGLRSSACSASSRPLLFAVRASTLMESARSTATSTACEPMEPVEPSMATLFKASPLPEAVSYTHLRAHETRHDLVCRLLLEKKKQKQHTHNTDDYQQGKDQQEEGKTSKR